MKKSPTNPVRFNERIKVKLQGLSPVQYRNQFIKTA
ncbi:IS3 family transposase [Acinetobacter baumannii]